MQITAEYIWLDGNNPQQLRSKTKILKNDPFDLPDFPEWGFDGSSTKQAEGCFSDCILRPVKFINDPFRKKGYLVMCEVYENEKDPDSTNTRCLIDYKEGGEYFHFGFEQEYFLYKNGLPLGVENLETLKPQGDFYCGVGSGQVKGREIAEEHLDACYEAGLEITGINAEVALGQWEYQLFGVGSKNASDDLWLSRYILYRIGEKHNIEINLHPKPIEEKDGYEANGSGMHINFSNKKLREEGGQEYVEEVMKEFKENHIEHINHYGVDNHKRLTGNHETQHINKFTFGVAHRGASVRIPLNVANNDFTGYLEDRRPASNADPYELTRLIMQRLKNVSVKKIIEKKGVFALN